MTGAGPTDGGPIVKQGKAIEGSAGWGKAALTAVIMLVVSIVVFVIVPNQLLTYLSRHVVPRERDLIVATWWAVSFVACCWLFVRLQGKRRG